MARDLETISALVSLVEEWRGSPDVRALVRELEGELAAGGEPFVGRPLERADVRDRLPAPLVSVPSVARYVKESRPEYSSSGV